MKKILILVLLFSGYIQAQIVNIPDANFKAKLLEASSTNFIAQNLAGQFFKIDQNDDGIIQVSEAEEVKNLNVPSSNIASLDGITSFVNIEYVICNDNLLTSLNLSGLSNLDNIQCNNNQIDNINLQGLINLTSLICLNNQITEIDVSMLTNLNTLNCTNNLLTTLDITSLTNLVFLACNNNQLVELFIKNNSTSVFTTGTLNFSGNSNLQYICVDTEDFAFVQNRVFNYGYLNCQINTYCSFTPGGNYNTITGNVKFDNNNNGCDATDFSIPFFKLAVDLNAMTTNSSVFSNNNGVYNLYTATEGVYTLTPVLENPTYFSVSPQPGTAIINEIDNTSTTLDFCVTANGVHPDLEVVIAPSTPARPGFVAEYVIVYKNKGNQVLSQLNGVSFDYNQNLMQFLSASTPPSAQSAGGLQWDYADLMPFESRSIVVSMQINPPTHPTHPVNIDDELIFTSVILPQAGDEMVQDNTFVFNQTVVGAYDPNDITCLQGDVVSPSEIGNYLHYVIRFENTGNAPAENVVVKVEIDPNQFDSNSLQMLSTSHDANIRMTGNRIEFIFENIQLDSGGHGNILLKMKTNETLQVGDYVEKKANIYFDYNFPIETNEAETLFEALSVVNPVLDSLISIYPNPVKDMLTIAIKDNSTIKTIELYDIQGRLLQTQLVNDVHSELNVSSRANGMYFIKINTDKGTKVEKLVKE
jgi:hypothetical protein